MIGKRMDARGFERPRKQPGSGVGLLEALIALVLFVLVFMPLLGVFTDTGSMQMEAVREHAAVLCVAERFLNTNLDAIENSRADPELDLDITALLEGDAQAAQALQGIEALSAAMAVQPVTGTARLYRVTVRVDWGVKPRRSLELATCKYAPDC
jgi:hypothetical protein